MQLNLAGKNIELTESLRNYVTTKCAKLEKISDRIRQAYIVLSVEKVKHIVSATLHIDGGELHATSEDNDMHSAIDGLVDKLTSQLNRHKNKLR